MKPTAPNLRRKIHWLLALILVVLCGSCVHVSRKEPMGRWTGEQVGVVFDAIARGDAAALKSAVKPGANIDGIYAPGSLYTPLHAAVAAGDADIVDTLLQVGADPNAPGDPEGNRPLHLAIRLLQTDLAELLLENGADPDLRNLDGDSPAGIARQRRQTTLVALIKSYGGKVHIADESARLSRFDLLKHDDQLEERLSRMGGHAAPYARLMLPAAVKMDDSRALKILCRYVRDIGQVTVDGPHPGTLLHEACRRGDTETAAYLITQGAPVDATNSLGETPLVTLFAPRTRPSGLPRIREDFFRRARLYRILVKSGADVNDNDSNGNNVLLNLLRWYGAPLDNVDGRSDGGGSFEDAWTEVFNDILSRIDDIDAVNQAGEGALYLALDENHKNRWAAETLIAAGADLRDPKHHGSEPSPYYSAIREGDAEALHNLYCDRGAWTYQDQFYEERIPQLGWAALYGQIDTMKQLLTYGADAWKIEVRPALGFGWTPLHYAVLRNNPDAAKVLLAVGASPMIPDDSGETPMMMANRLRRRALARHFGNWIRKRNRALKHQQIPVLEAAKTGNLNALKDTLLTHPRRIRSQVPPALVESIGHRQHETTEWLLPRLQVNDFKFLEEPLMAAASVGDRETWDVLSRFADSCPRPAWMATYCFPAMKAAAVNGEATMAAYLMRCTMNSGTVPNKDLQSTAQWLLDSGHVESALVVIDLLPDEMPFEGSRAIDYAAREQSPFLAQKILDRGFRVTESGFDSAFLVAVHYADSDFLKVLKEYGVMPSEGAIQKAIESLQHNGPAKLALLMEYGIPRAFDRATFELSDAWREEDAEGAALLLRGMATEPDGEYEWLHRLVTGALKDRDVPFLELVYLSASVLLTPVEKEGLLCLAAEEGRLDVIRRLLKVDVSANCDCRGESPLDRATRWGHDKAAQLLKENGAVGSGQRYW